MKPQFLFIEKNEFLNRNLLTFFIGHILASSFGEKTFKID